MEEIKKPIVPTLFFWLGLIVSAWLLCQFWPDRAYYWLPKAQRILHPHHGFLKPSGRDGLSFGAVATVLLVVNLTYLIRKEFINFSWLGSLRSWMAFHVFTGVLAGLLVLLHSALLLSTAPGILAFTSLWIVILTGLIGRYIYAHTPRSLKGYEVELAELLQNLANYRVQLEKMGMPKDFFERDPKRDAIQGSDKGLFRKIVALAAGDRELSREHRRLRALVKSHPSLQPMSKRLLPIAKRYCQERQWVARYTELRSLMGSWRFLHRWFAIALISAVAFHIWVAYQMGQLWLVDVLKQYLRQHR